MDLLENTNKITSKKFILLITGERDSEIKELAMNLINN